MIALIIIILAILTLVFTVFSFIICYEKTRKNQSLDEVGILLLGSFFLILFVTLAITILTFHIEKLKIKIENPQEVQKIEQIKEIIEKD